MKRISGMDIAAKLPAMEEAALSVLRANAERLQRTGTKAQKTAAETLMPAIEAEISARRAAKLSLARETAAAAAKRRTTKTPPLEG
jgi:hypothetical protein